MSANPVNCCRSCGATSYRRVLARDARGVLAPTGLYRCSGCEVVFAHTWAWRGDAEPGPEPDTLPPTTPDTRAARPPLAVRRPASAGAWGAAGALG